MVLGHYLMVSKWRPNFVPTDEGVANMRVWLCLINMPMEQFYEEALLGMASGVGTPVRIEHTAINVTMGRYVELNLHKSLVPVLNVMGRRQEVEYEGLYRVCYKCGQFGHQMDQCPTTTNLNVEGKVTSVLECIRNRRQEAHRRTHLAHGLGRRTLENVWNKSRGGCHVEVNHQLQTKL